ncbi:MAG: hypothetical protein WKF82_05285 [Nocardioidaceae bacterium]
MELDAAPLLSALGVRAEHPRVEIGLTAGTTGRFDLVISDAEHPVALLELKIGASQHGDQFERWEQWSRSHGGVPCHLVSFGRPDHRHAPRMGQASAAGPAEPLAHQRPPDRPGSGGSTRGRAA